MHQEHSYGIIPYYRHPDGSLHFLTIQHRRGHWAFPKGGAEANESQWETALRELKEETGLDIVKRISETPLTEHYHFMRRGMSVDKEVGYFLAEVEKKDLVLQEEEVQAYFWGRADQIMSRLSFPEVQRVFQMALDMLE